MSERQAKRSRKETAANKVEIKQKNGKKVLSNIVVAAVIAAVAALGVYATWDKITPIFTANNGEVVQQQESQTIAEYAESQGTTADELLAKCGMTELGLTGDSDMSEMQSQFTIDSYAKFTDKTAEELKAENGIEDLADDTNWTEATMKIPMGKIAEQSGMSFEDFAAQSGLPAEITEDMTQEDAIMLMQKQMEDAPADETNEEAEAPAEETEE